MQTPIAFCIDRDRYLDHLGFMLTETIIEEVPPQNDTLVDIEAQIHEIDRKEKELIEKRIEIDRQISELRKERKRLQAQGTTRVSSSKTNWANERCPIWTEDRINLLRVLANENTPYREIGQRIGVTEHAARAKANRLGFYNRKQKKSPSTAADDTGVKSVLRKKRESKTEPTDYQETEPATCQIFHIHEARAPEGVWDVIEYIKSKFTKKEQWAYLRAYLQAWELPA